MPWSSSATRPSPGTARNRSAVAPSDQSSALTEYGTTPGAGWWSRVEANRPVWLSRRGKVAAAPAPPGCGPADRSGASGRGRAGRARRRDPRRKPTRCSGVRASSWCQATASSCDREAPDDAGLIITVDVGPGQLGQARAVIHVAAGDRGRLGVRVHLDRRQDRRRPAPAFDMHRLRTLHDAPAVVAPALDLVDQLPQLPADVADPQVARGPVDAHLPRDCESRRPRSRAARPGCSTNGLSGGMR